MHLNFHRISTAVNGRSLYVWTEGVKKPDVIYEYDSSCDDWTRGIISSASRDTSYPRCSSGMFRLLILVIINHALRCLAYLAALYSRETS